MYGEIGNWVLTDPDTAQYRRRLPDMDGNPVFELVQVNQYVDLYRVAHGRIYFGADVTEEEKETLLDAYFIERDLFHELPEEEQLGQLAEMSFETGGTEYDTTDDYDSFEAAQTAVLRIVEEKDVEPSGALTTFGQFYAELVTRIQALGSDAAKSKKSRESAMVDVAAKLFKEAVNEDEYLLKLGLGYIPQVKGPKSDTLTMYCWARTDEFFSLRRESWSVEGLPLVQFRRKKGAIDCTPLVDGNMPMRDLFLKQMWLHVREKDAAYEAIRQMGKFFADHGVSEAEQERLWNIIKFLENYSCNRVDGVPTLWRYWLLSPTNRTVFLDEHRRSLSCGATYDALILDELNELRAASRGEVKI